MLYMFQAVPEPIIRSSKLYTQHRVFVEVLLLLTACGKKQLMFLSQCEKLGLTPIYDNKIMVSFILIFIILFLDDKREEKR